MAFSSSQSKTLAILPKCTGAISLIGSTYIFQDVILHKKTKHRVYHRLMLGLSTSDMIASVVNLLSTWPSPTGTPGVMFASGTTQTCTAQGFFNELGNMATPLYNASLCLYYVLVIRMQWPEQNIKKKAEPYMHLLPICIALLISILGIPFTLYNNSGWLCWIAQYPKSCSADDGTCTRGEHSNIFRWVHYAIIWSAILFVTGGMYSIYRMVKRQERARSQGSSKSKKVAIQAALYVGGLYLTWIFTTITRIYNIVTGTNNFVLLVLMAIFFPLQGFFNCIVYLRPRYLRSKSRNPDATFKRLLWLTLHNESHPIHGIEMTQEQKRMAQREEEERRRQSAMYYSVGNSKNPPQYLESDDINTVNGVTSLSEYTPEALAAKAEAKRLEKEEEEKRLSEVGEVDSQGKRESYYLEESRIEEEARLILEAERHQDEMEMLPPDQRPPIAEVGSLGEDDEELGEGGEEDEEIQSDRPRRV